MTLRGQEHQNLLLGYWNMTRSNRLGKKILMQNCKHTDYLKRLMDLMAIIFHFFMRCVFVKWNLIFYKDSENFMGALHCHTPSMEFIILCAES